MTADEQTLANIRKKALPEAQNLVRLSDFLSDQEKQELAESNARGKEQEKPYDNCDAYEAEMIARFGFDAYKAWLNGDIDEHLMARMIAAERDREKQLLAPILAMIYSANAGANNPADKNGHAPKSLRIAQDLLNKFIK